MKTPERIADDLWQHFDAGIVAQATEIERSEFFEIVVAAVEADRAQRDME